MLLEKSVLTPRGANIGELGGKENNYLNSVDGWAVDQ
jgi:hypothetical protein